MRYLIHLSYKGTNYHGWQKQLNARSVQATLDEKLQLLLGEPIETLGCGRTDTGVHAKNYYAHFDSEKAINEQQLVFKLNHILPKDVAIFSVQQVPAHFNVRFDAEWREYEYFITQIPDPFLLEGAWFQYGKLDVAAMNEAAALLIGKKSFESFSKVHTQVNHFVCDVMVANWDSRDNKLVFTIRANRFLRNMVRAVVGTLVEVGKGKLTLSDVKNILDSKNRCEASQSAPALGLYLTKIYYPHLRVE
jgi:tRNA pseudouridine38-40 synthase